MLKNLYLQLVATDGINLSFLPGYFLAIKLTNLVSDGSSKVDVHSLATRKDVYSSYRSFVDVNPSSVRHVKNL